MKYLRKISVSIVMMIAIVVMGACAGVTPFVSVGYEEQVYPKLKKDEILANWFWNLGGSVELGFADDGIVFTPCFNAKYNWMNERKVPSIDVNNFDYADFSNSLVSSINNSGLKSIPSYVCVEVDSRR